MLKSLFNTIAVQKELQLYHKEALSRYDAVFVTKFLLQKNFLEFQ